MNTKGVRWIKHYNSSQKILLVGEGDFSFSACLARAFHNASNMVATCLHSKDTLLTMHWSSQTHLEELKKRGCMVLYEVDVYDMDQHPTLKNMKFDIIIFNFPHAGHVSWLNERDDTLIRMHKELIGAFFKSASKMLNKEGEVHVTHRGGYPYNKWMVEKLGNKAGLMLKEKVDFRKSDYPGYHNKRGGRIDSNRTFPLKRCFTFKFTLQQCSSHQDSERDCDAEITNLAATPDDLHVLSVKTMKKGLL